MHHRWCKWNSARDWLREEIHPFKRAVTAVAAAGVVVRAWGIARRGSTRGNPHLEGWPWLPGKYDNAHGDDKTDGSPRFPRRSSRWLVVEPRIWSKRIFRTDLRGFSRCISGPTRISSRLPASVFLSVDCAALSRRASSVEHREAIILERTRNSRKKPLLRRGGELMNGADRRTLEFRRVCANRIIFVCGG